MDLYLLQKYIGAGEWEVVKVTNDREEATLWDISGNDSAVLDVILNDITDGRTLLLDIKQGLWVFSGSDKSSLDVLSPVSLSEVPYEIKGGGGVNILC